MWGSPEGLITQVTVKLCGLLTKPSRTTCKACHAVMKMAKEKGLVNKSLGDDDDQADVPVKAELTEDQSL